MSAVAQSARVGRLAKVLAEQGIDAFFACSTITMSYLMGYAEHGGERFLTMAVNPDGRVRLICPALSENQARRIGFEDVAAWRDGEDPLALVENLANDWNLKTGILAVDDEMQAQMLLKMQATLPAALFKPGQDAISQLMRNKEEAELALLRKAGKIADDSWDAVIPRIAAGLTELEVEAMLL